jgi:hypothetical protein
MPRCLPAPDAVQQRDAEAQRLAHAGAGLADEVVAGHREREGELLDRERALDAGLAESLDDLRLDAEGREGRVFGLDLDARLQRVRGVERGRAGLAVFQRDGGGLFGCGNFCGQGDRLSRDQRAQPWVRSTLDRE